MVSNKSYMSTILILNISNSLNRFHHQQKIVIVMIKKIIVMQDFGQILNKGLDYVRDTTSEYSVKTIILTVRHKSLDHLISSIFV